MHGPVGLQPVIVGLSHSTDLLLNAVIVQSYECKREKQEEEGKAGSCISPLAAGCHQSSVFAVISGVFHLL